MTFGSLFAGVGGFDLGLERAGLSCRFQIEIEAFCRRVLARHWPIVARHDDVRDVCGSLLRADDGRCAECGRRGWLPWVDVLCGGFPCQDLSIAGKRKGLAGERSGLFYQFTRHAAELRPTWVLLENVDGLLSSHLGTDFSLVLRELEDVGYVAGAWRVLDSRWFGVPQRRNRVFIVGCLRGSGRHPEAVLFESARRSWDSPARGQAQAHVAATLRGRSHGTGVNPPGRGGEDDSNLIAGPLGGGNDGIGRRSEDDPNLVYSESGPGWWNERVGPLRAEGENRPSRPSTLVAHALSSSSTRTGRLDPNGETFIASALTSSMGHRGYGSPRGDGNDNLIAPTLATSRRGTDLERHHEVADGGVRRLTPLECERLQGFPDGWTCLCGVTPYSTRTCVCKDGPRYKALGNAVTVPVIEWIGHRLMAEERRATNQREDVPA